MNRTWPGADARRFAVAGLAAALVIVVGCLFDSGPTPTLENVWPNEDGTRWSYELTWRTWADASTEIYARPEDVPPAPTLDEVVALLKDHPVGEDPRSETGAYHLRFDGTVTTESGVTAQHLVEEYEPPLSRDAASVPPLVRHLWVVRPDLREKLVAAGLSPALRGDPSLVVAPLFLSGYAWERTPDWIGGYGDLTVELARIYLESDLAPGHEFTMQLVPTIADDVFLYARILPRRTVKTPDGKFRSVVECLYLVDTGVFAVSDEFGGVLGWAGFFTYGTVAYSPDTGPVASYERAAVPRADTLLPGGGDFDIALTEWERGSR